MEPQVVSPRRRWLTPIVSTAPSVAPAVLLACTKGFVDCSRFGDPPNTCVDKPCMCPSFPGKGC